MSEVSNIDEELVLFQLLLNNCAKKNGIRSTYLFVMIIYTVIDFLFTINECFT